jgi:glycosyltransferase involved in cell wall biosynthesis
MERGERLQGQKGEEHMPSTQVIIAALNEEEGIGLTIAELHAHLGYPHVLVVDGKSTDRTIEVAKSRGADVILQDGLGKGDAVAKALKYLDFAADYVVFIDADFTYPAEFVPEMIEILEQDHRVGMVIGNRFKGEASSKKFFANAFYLGNRLLAFAQNVVNGFKLEDPLSGLRVVRKEILEGWKPKSKGFDVEAEMNYRVEQKGFEIVEIPINYRARLGEKKLKLRHGFGILKRIISESFFA